MNTTALSTSLRNLSRTTTPFAKIILLGLCFLPLVPRALANDGKTVVVSNRYEESRAAYISDTSMPNHSNFIVRLGRTLVQWPRVISETIMGDRQLVNRRGFLGTRYEIPDDED